MGSLWRIKATEEATAFAQTKELGPPGIRDTLGLMESLITPVQLGQNRDNRDMARRMAAIWD